MSWNPDLFQKAMNFAAEAHLGQKIPGSELPYVVHLAEVCQEALLACTQEPGLQSDLVLCCALLHDVLEDTSTPAERLEASFGPQVLAGVRALTKSAQLPKREAMMDSLHRILQQPPEVAAVKMADRITNLQPPPHYWNKEKCASYREEAALILEQLGPASAHLARRLGQKIEEYAVYV